MKHRPTATDYTKREQKHFEKARRKRAALSRKNIKRNREASRERA